MEVKKEDKTQYHPPRINKAGDIIIYNTKYFKRMPSELSNL